MLDRDTVSRALRRMAPAVFALLAACSAPPSPPPESAAMVQAGTDFQPLAGTTDHVGRAVCGQCHQAQLDAWQGSDHDLAMQVPTAASVLGDFSGATFDYAGTTSTFSQRDGRYFVRSDGADGALAEFEIRYTFGHYPLQQYLIELPGGRLQAFGIAWDSRPQAAGGQRWFHLYPDRALKAGDRLHWTGRDQNWNFMCAECHSTGLAKNYAPAQDSYHTTWAEIDVSCESCHGPGLAHARWASQPEAARAGDAAKGLAVQFHERRGITWLPSAETGIAQRSAPRTGRVEIDACGRCHGRANRLVGGEAHGGSLLDSHRPALLDPDQYWPDGQMRGEVFNWGPFLESRMQQAGVTCSDCHQPHSLELRAQGNALCAQCHAPARFDRASHTHHAPGSAGSQCVACHMPEVTFMGVDARHDHGFRIPRPDRHAPLGTPDACTSCHAERDANWAADQLQQWFPDSTRRDAGFAEVLQGSREGAPQIGRRLAELAGAPAQPAIVRASALRAMAPWLNQTAARQAAAGLGDPDPLVRMAAVETLAQIAPAQRAELLGGALGDPVLAVRMEAAAALAGPAEDQLDATQRAAFARALAEYETSLVFNADRADTVASHGELFLRRGDPAAAEQAFRRALDLDPSYSPAWLHLVDLARAQGDEAAAMATLDTALAQLPQAAELHHARALALIRAGRTQEAMSALERAVARAPDTAHYAFVFGVALHDQGQADRARTVLAEALARQPWDRELLNTLALYAFQAGERTQARSLAARLVALDPDDPAARQLQAWVAQD